jgi:hypothetical protein
VNLVRRCSSEGRVGPVAPRASSGRGGSLGPVHGDGGAMRWSGDGEARRKQRRPAAVAYRKRRRVVRGLDKRYGRPLNRRVDPRG